MHLLGMAGHPRQYAQITEVHYLQPLLPLQRFITWAALLTTAGQLIFLWNLFAALIREKESEANPWQSTTLEWIPLAESGQVQCGPYEFIPGAASDFDPQAGPAEEQAHLNDSMARIASKSEIERAPSSGGGGPN